MYHIYFNLKNDNIYIKDIDTGKFLIKMINGVFYGVHFKFNELHLIHEYESLLFNHSVMRERSIRQGKIIKIAEYTDLRLIHKINEHYPEFFI